MLGFIQRRRKRTLVIAAAVLALVIVGAAVAAYLSIGTGSTSSGPVALGTVQSEAVTVTSNGCQTGCSNPLSPGGAQGWQVSVKNNNADTVSIGQLTGSVDAASLPAGCVPGWFTVDTTPINQTLTNNQTLTANTMIHFVDTGNQNACSGGHPTFTFTVGP